MGATETLLGFQQRFALGKPRLQVVRVVGHITLLSQSSCHIVRRLTFREHFVTYLLFQGCFVALVKPSGTYRHRFWRQKCANIGGKLSSLDKVSQFTGIWTNRA